MATTFPAPSSRPSAVSVVTSDDGAGLTTIRIRGPVDSSTVERMREVLSRCDASGLSLLLDLTGVRGIDEAGIAALQMFATRVHSGGRRLAVLAPDPVAAVLALSATDHAVAVRVTLH